MYSRFIATTLAGDVLTKDRLVPDDEARSVHPWLEMYPLR
jgi:hypothetical protein